MNLIGTLFLRYWPLKSTSAGKFGYFLKIRGLRQMQIGKAFDIIHRTIGILLHIFLTEIKIIKPIFKPRRFGCRPRAKRCFLLVPVELHAHIFEVHLLYSQQWLRLWPVGVPCTVHFPREPTEVGTAGTRTLL